VLHLPITRNIEFFHKNKAAYNSLHSVLRNISYALPVMYSLVFHVQNKGKWHSITITVRNKIQSHHVVCLWALFPGTLHGNMTTFVVNCSVQLQLQCPHIETLQVRTLSGNRFLFTCNLLFSSSPFFFILFFFHFDGLGPRACSHSELITKL
jgi:hypothetical protein